MNIFDKLEIIGVNYRKSLDGEFHEHYPHDRYTFTLTFDRDGVQAFAESDGRRVLLASAFHGRNGKLADEMDEVVDKLYHMFYDGQSF